MTAVVWSPDTNILAADCRASYSNGRYSDETVKLGFGKDFVAAWSGDLSYVRRFFNKWQSVTDKNIVPKVSYIDIISDLEHARELHAEMDTQDTCFNLLLFYLDAYDEVQGVEFTNGCIFSHFDITRPYAIGSGGDICLGAVHAGALPEKAIAIAADITTTVSHKSNSVNVLDFLVSEKARQVVK